MNTLFILLLALAVIAFTVVLNKIYGQLNQLQDDINDVEHTARDVQQELNEKYTDLLSRLPDPVVLGSSDQAGEVWKAITNLVAHDNGDVTLEEVQKFNLVESNRPGYYNLEEKPQIPQTTTLEQTK